MLAELGRVYPSPSCLAHPSLRPGVGVGKLSEPQNSEEGGRAEEQAGAFVSGLGLAVIRGFTAVINGRSLKGVYGPGNEKQPAGPQPSEGSG